MNTKQHALCSAEVWRKKYFALLAQWTLAKARYDEQAARQLYAKMISTLNTVCFLTQNTLD